MALSKSSENHAQTAPPPETTYSSPNEFHVYPDMGFLKRKGIDITFADKRTCAYHVETHSKFLVIHRGAPTGPIVGHVQFHSFSSFVDIQYEHGEKVEMAREGIMSRSHCVRMPAAPGTHEFRWKGTWGGGSHLEDSQGTKMAHFDMKMFSSSKSGVLTLLVTGLSQAFVDQILVSFVAMEEKQRRQRRSRGAGAAGGGGA